MPRTSHRFPRIQRPSGPYARRPHGKTPVVSEPNCATSDGRLTDADARRRFFLLLREHADAHATGDRNLSATWSSLSSDTLNPYEYRREPRLSTLPISPVDCDRRFVAEPLSNSASSDAAPTRFLMGRRPRPKPSSTLGCRHIAAVMLCGRAVQRSGTPNSSAADPRSTKPSKFSIAQPTMLAHNAPQAFFVEALRIPAGGNRRWRKLWRIS